MNKFIIVLIFLVVYFLGTNFVANILINDSEGDINNLDGEADVNVGFSDKVTVSVKRVRFYGTINEIENLNTLKVFNIARLPLKVNQTNWVYFHLLFLAGLIIFIKIKSDKEKKWESNLDGEYSSYSLFLM